MVLLFIWAVLIISHNFCSKIYSGKLWVLRKVCLIHVRKISKANIWLHFGFHTSQEHSIKSITVIDKNISQSIDDMCDISNMLSKIPTKFRSVELGFYLYSLITIIFFIQSCWAYNVYKGLWVIKITLQFVNILITFVMIPIPFHRSNSIWFRLYPTNGFNPFNVHLVYLPNWQWN